MTLICTAPYEEEPSTFGVGCQLCDTHQEMGGKKAVLERKRKILQHYFFLTDTFIYYENVLRSLLKSTGNSIFIFC